MRFRKPESPRYPRFCDLFVPLRASSCLLQLLGLFYRGMRPSVIESDLPRSIGKSSPQNSELWRGNEKKNPPNKDI